MTPSAPASRVGDTWQCQDPGFQERATAAADAKARALAQLRAKPLADVATMAAGRERRAARETAEAEKRARVSAAREQIAAAKLASKAEAARAALNAVPASVLSDPERKAARDAKYAARKNRKAAR